MIDKSRDISRKEQMAIVLRYVNKNGLVVEHFLGVEHVTSTTTLSLKATLDNLFSRHGLSFSRLRGQGYDGASNMQEEFNGLKTLVLKENRCAYYIHCFAHQLQLALMPLAKNHDDVDDLFNIMAIVVNIVGTSSKHCDLLRDKQACKVIETLSNGELSSGKGLNQETNLQRASDTRWGSHYDMQLQELNNRFNEINTELLICLACLCPNESFIVFDKQKLIRLAKLYPDDFSDLELMALDSQLDVYILDMHSNVKFMGLKGIGDLAK
ncbi:uncharacterized protein LOC116144431 [Pistacia vera]|uniref:uncharacterized protein LOC116144431 n=1 Tax=Pistacia vera TaxID=55513 RepID=UPI001262C8E6|nr:uncharacterized protein LOC116144431 [Pistacia vera]